MDLTALATAIGRDGPVVAVGGRTHWHVGGEPDADAIEVRAPAGIVELEPAEMIVRCGAGTTVAELDAALAAVGQMVPLDPALPVRATVGGVLATGWSGMRRLRYGPVRDVLLEARFVTAEGKVVRAGAPVVKNVTGFDLCRLLVGSLGTLGVIGEVVLRCQPVPTVSRWLASDGVDPFDVASLLHRPGAILSDGRTTWVLLEGHEGDVSREAARLAGSWAEAMPPPNPYQCRHSIPPRDLRTLDLEPGTYLAEVGVGTVHLAEPAGLPAFDERLHALQRELKRRFDPHGRLGAGRMAT